MPRRRLRLEMDRIEKRTAFVWMHFVEVMEAENGKTYDFDQLGTLCEDMLDSANDPRKREMYQMCYHRTLKSMIEGTLRSNLKELVLRREKHKIFYERDEFFHMSIKIKIEVDELSHYLQPREILQYIRLYLTSNTIVEVQVERFFRSGLKTWLALQMQFAGRDEAKFKFYKARVQREWDSLTKYLKEEAVVAYAYEFLRSIGKSNPFNLNTGLF